jgi:hypothetical protein
LLKNCGQSVQEGRRIEARAGSRSSAKIAGRWGKLNRQVLWLHVEDGDLGLGPRLADDLEELALSVGLHVYGNDTRRPAATSRTIGDPEPSADASELAGEVRVHEGEDTITVGRVRWQSS